MHHFYFFSPLLVSRELALVEAERKMQYLCDITLGYEKSFEVISDQFVDFTKKLDFSPYFKGRRFGNMNANMGITLMNLCLNIAVGNGSNFCHSQI